MRRFLYLVLALFVIAALSQAKVTLPQHPDATTAPPVAAATSAAQPVLQLPPALVGNADPHPFVHEFYPAPEQQKSAVRHVATAP